MMFCFVALLEYGVLLALLRHSSPQVPLTAITKKLKRNKTPKFKVVRVSKMDMHSKLRRFLLDGTMERYRNGKGPVRNGTEEPWKIPVKYR